MVTNFQKKIINSFMRKLLLSCLFVFLLSSANALAFDFENLALGLMTGYGVGVGNCSGCGIPNISNDDYQFFTLLATGTYEFADRNAVRLGFGFDAYTKKSPYANNLFFAGTADYILRFKGDRGFFDPYALAGVRFPTFNVGLGVGNEFLITDHFGLTAEIAMNTFFTIDQRFEGRVGLVRHF
jgi:hypothetical protein